MLAKAEASTSLPGETAGRDLGGSLRVHLKSVVLESRPYQALPDPFA